MSDFDGDRHIAIGAYSSDDHTTALESDAFEIFRSIEPVDIAYALTDLVASPDQLYAAIRDLRAGYGVISSYQEHLDYRLNREPEAVNRLPADVRRLFEIFCLFDGNRIVERHPAPFQSLVGTEDSAETMVHKAVGITVGMGAQLPLLLALTAAFTPKSERQELGTLYPFRSHERAQIVDSTADLSELPNPEARLDAVIAMLIPPGREIITQRYAATLRQLCLDRNIMPEDLNDNQPLSKELHRLAGAAVFAGNLFAVLNDTARVGGYGSVFRVHEHTHGGPQRTQRGKCPAVAFAGSYLHAVGLMLQANRQVVLGFMLEGLPEE